MTERIEFEAYWKDWKGFNLTTHILLYFHSLAVWNEMDQTLREGDKVKITIERIK